MKIHYFMMWAVFVMLFTLGTVGLEIMEGNKITTTFYHGLRNIGMFFVLFIFFFSFILYLISFLPLTFIINKFVHLLIVKIVIYSLIGGISGKWVFNLLYGVEEGSLIVEYNLNIWSAVIIFGVAGFIYAFFDHYLKKPFLHYDE